MKTMRIVLILSFVSFLVGCSFRPAELRGLQPVMISVSDNGTPLEGILVVLVDKDQPRARACNALTNARGNAKISTTLGSHSAGGAKGGRYAVLLSKPFSWPKELEPKETDYMLPRKEQEALQKKRDEYVEKNRVVPAVLELRETTPIELTIEGRRGAKLDIDVSKY